MMRHFPQPEIYTASLYKPETHAPDCDNYLFDDDLLKLGIGWSDKKRREVRVPFAMDQTIQRRGKFVFITDGLGEPVLCSEYPLLIDGLRSSMLFRHDAALTTEKVQWIRDSCEPRTKIVKNGLGFGVQFQSDDDLILFRMKWEGMTK